MRPSPLLLLACVGCSFPRPKDLPTDAEPSPDAGAAPGDFVANLDGARIHLTEGSTTTVGIKLDRNAFADAISVTVGGLPDGVTADPLTIAGDSGTLILHGTIDATQGEAALTVTAASATRSHDIPLSLLTMGLPGTLDKSFHWVSSSLAPNAQISAIAVQPDGKIVIAGPPTLVADERSLIVAARYLADGTRDTTFAAEAIAFDSAITSIDAITLQPDGKIVVVGTCFSGGVVVRLNTSGAPDSTFGKGGLVTLELSAETPTSTAFRAVALQPDGGILVAGHTVAVQQNRDAIIVRLTPEGSIDRSFGAMGHTTAPFGAGQNEFLAMALQPDGKIVAAGTAIPPGVSSGAVLARFDRGGQLDNTFHGNGMYIVGARDTVGGLGSAGWVTIQPTGKIVAGGSATDGVGLVRLNGSDGSADTSFGAGGFKEIGIALAPLTFGPLIRGIIQQPDGRIIVGGSAPNGVINLDPDVGGSNYDTFAARFTSDGLLDFSFAGSGVVSHDFSADNGLINGLELLAGIAFDPDGRIVVASDSLSPGNTTPYYSTIGRFWP